MRGRLLGPVELLRLPGEAVDGARRASASLRTIALELAAIRAELEAGRVRIDDGVRVVERDVPAVRRRIDEAVDSAPTKGPVDKVKDAFSG